MIIKLFTQNQRQLRIADFILILMFFTSTDTILFGTNHNQLFLYVPRIMGLLGFVLFPLLTVGSVNYVKRDNAIYYSILFITIIVISSIINGDTLFSTLSRVITLIAAYAIVENFSIRQFQIAFSNFMYFVTIVAIVVDIVAYAIPSLLSLLPIVTNTAGNAFYSFFIGSIELSEMSRSLIRSNGIFWEPGAFAIYLVFNIIIELFAFERINSKRLVVSFLGVILTFSTTGYIVLVVVTTAFLISSRSEAYSRNAKILICISIIGVLVFSIVFESNTIVSGVFGKLTNLSTNSSANTRFSSLYNGMKVALIHPVFGVAGNTGQYMSMIISEENAKFTIGGTIISNTIVGLSASYGLIVGVLFVFGYYRYARKISDSRITALLIFFAIVLAYSGERFFSFMPFVFSMYGISEDNNEDINQLELSQYNNITERSMYDNGYDGLF